MTWVVGVESMILGMRVELKKKVKSYIGQRKIPNLKHPKLLTFFTQRSKNLVSRKAWPHPPIIGGRSSSSSGGNAQNGLSSPVSCPALGSGAPVTPILGISDVSSTGWVRFPSTILTTYRIDVGSNGTFEITWLSQIAF